MVGILLFCWPLITASNTASQSIKEELLKNLTYRNIGPTRQGGRFVDFAVPKQKPYTFYAATASGGLWKTVNNGITFEPIFDHEKVFSIGDVTVAPSNPNIVWVGTGEANNSRSSYWGDGVYKSTDAGKTWKNMGLKESHYIGRIVIHPKDPDIIYVATLGHLYSEDPERGLYKTTNGGKKWIKVMDVVAHGKNIGVVDIAMHPSNPEIIYAATYDKERKPWTFNLGGPGSAVYKTADGGRSWTKLGGGIPTGMIGRIGIDVYRKNPNILYVTVENANKPKVSDEGREKELLEGKSSRGMIGGEVYRSDDAGKTWKKVSPDGQSIGGAPAYYYGQIIIDPNDDKVVHVLSAASWGTTDGGKTWKRRPLGFGGDDHALWIDPDNSNHMILGYDHGMGITYDGGKNWTKMKTNMPTQPVHDLVIHPRENDLVVATHGRGFFITDITPLQELTPKILSKDVHLFDIESKVRWINNKFNVSSSSNFDGKSEPKGIVINYYLKSKVKGDVEVTIYKGDKFINVMKGKGAAGINKVVWDMTIRRKRTEEEKKKVRERRRRFRASGFRRPIDINYAHDPVPLGEYKIVLKVGDRKFTKNASVLQDHWYDK